MNRRAFEAGIALLAGSLTYLVLLAGNLPVYVYLPTEHHWSWNAPHGVIAMDWFFRVAVSLFAALATGCLARLAGRRMRALDAPGPMRFVFGLGFAVAFWACTYMVFGLITTPRARHPLDAVSIAPRSR